jgi:Zn-dependent M16 (insulinase) family peptidase
MQDLRDNYEPLLKDGPIEIVDSWGYPGTQAKYRQFALDHQKQMGMLALKGMKLMDRHSGNVMQHAMTGRPMQLDAGIAKRVTGGEQVETLVEATSEGFKASGQPDIAEIISDTAYDYLAGGQVEEAWSFTKEAFANLQKIKKPLPEASIHYKGNRYADLGRIDEILSKALKEANNTGLL